MANIAGIELNDGRQLPAIGFGTWELADGEETEAAVEAAVSAGYRLIDTAAIYGNETSVGVGLKTSGVAREAIFLTTKLWNRDQGYESALTAFEKSRERLGVDYVDLYLIHWPGSDRNARRESWDALTDLRKDGLAKSIGVSNYHTEHLEELLGRQAALPAVNQIELHPYIYKEQKPVLDFCAAHGIAVEAYSPLVRGRGLGDETIRQVAAAHGKTAAQVMVRWAIQHGTVPIPKSAHAERIRENMDVFDFELSQKEMSQLDNLS